MTSPRLKVVRRAIEAMNARQADDELMRDLFDPGIELLDIPEAPGRHSYRGYEGVEEFVSDAAENWKTNRIEVEELRELGDKIVLLGDQTAVGAMAGVPVTGKFAEIFEFEGDRIIRMRMFRDHTEALEAARDA
jgi:ketosteroid isomerase-like protein